MMDSLRVLLRRIGPGLEHFKDEEIVLVDEAGSASCRGRFWRLRGAHDNNSKRGADLRRLGRILAEPTASTTWDKSSDIRFMQATSMGLPSYGIIGMDCKLSLRC